MGRDFFFVVNYIDVWLRHHLLDHQMSIGFIAKPHNINMNLY